VPKVAADFDLPALLRVPDAHWSVMVRDAYTGAVLLSCRPDAVLRTASVGKVFLLIEVARLIEGGELDPNERLAWQPEEYVADSGIWHLLSQRDLSVGDLCLLVGAVSDNLATNVLLRRVGLEAVQVRSRVLGYTRSTLLDRVRYERLAAHPPTLSTGCAAELSDLMSRLHRGVVVSAAVSARVSGWLSVNTDLSMVAAAFDLDPLAHSDADRALTLLNKTGTISTARADVGVVSRGGAAVAYAVLADWSPDVDPRNDVLAAMRLLGGHIRHLLT
jgi:beta-lactamase class A